MAGIFGIIELAIIGAVAIACAYYVCLAVGFCAAWVFQQVFGEYK